MKKYFENEEYIIPFSSVHSVRKTDNTPNCSFIWVSLINHSIIDYPVAIDKSQLDNYLLWLDSKL
jgi:hypothetical protein